MRQKLAAGIAIVLCLALPGFPHRLDEYLQAAMISLHKDRVDLSLRLVPGVAVLPTVLAVIDANRDGLISDAERQAYAKRVLDDISLSVDAQALRLQLGSVNFPTMDEIKQGLGEIQIETIATLPPGSGVRKLILQNHHASRISVYLVNCLMPRDRDVRVLAQNRNQNQSLYELDYTQRSGPWPLAAPSSSVQASLGNLGGFANVFRLGMRHIAEGTDHLLFLLALLLPAPLVTLGPRWAGFSGVRRSLIQILRVVTAFTLGHSITLALAGLGFVVVPSRPVEILIAVSILVSAIHACRPIFPGREPLIAAFFGLIHGLAFAATLSQLGLGTWARLVNIFSFNLGIETMQLIAVAATMPSLVLLSRTRAYPFLRIGGALFAALASTGWIAERLLDMNYSVDLVVDNLAHHAFWIAGVLFLSSLFCWSLTGPRPKAGRPVTEEF